MFVHTFVLCVCARASVNISVSAFLCFVATISISNSLYISSHRHTLSYQVTRPFEMRVGRLLLCWRPLCPHVDHRSSESRAGCHLNDEYIPTPPRDVLRVGELMQFRSKEKLFLVRFFDSKRNWWEVLHSEKLSNISHITAKCVHVSDTSGLGAVFQNNFRVFKLNM